MIFFCIWLAGAAATFYPVTRGLAAAMAFSYRDPDLFEAVMAGILGFICAAVWPITWLSLGVRWVAFPDSRGDDW